MSTVSGYEWYLMTCPRKMDEDILVAKLIARLFVAYLLYSDVNPKKKKRFVQPLKQTVSMKI